MLTVYHLPQELIQVTKQKMMEAVKEKIRRLHEDRIISEFSKGARYYYYIYTCIQHA